MKKKNNESEIVTKGFFKRELKRELTRELQNFEERMDVKIDAKMELKFNSFQGKIEQMLITFRSEIFSKIDSFVKEIRNSHEERAIVSNQVSDLRDRVDEHEVRIQKLETTT